MTYGTLRAAALVAHNAGHSGIGTHWDWQDFASSADARAFKDWAQGAGFDAKFSTLHPERNRIVSRPTRAPTHIDPAPHVNAPHGAPMGRPGCNTFEDKAGRTHELTITGRCHLVRVRLDRGGYDAGGAYWGLDAEALYFFERSGVYGYVRGRSREAAKTAVRKLHPAATFYR